MPTTPAPQVDGDACLQAHNAKRALHQNTPALVWDATLAQHAKDWADVLAQNGSIHHATGTGEGENLYKYSTSGSTVETCADAVESWYNEISLYDYNNPPQTLQEFNDVGYGHFTQVVWKGTTHVGAGLKKMVDSNGYTNTYIVARYSPQGNIIGQFGANVKPEN
ncbi:ectin-like [Oculina patagonica]